MQLISTYREFFAVLIMSLPILLMSAILFWRITSSQVRWPLVLSHLWTFVGLYVFLINVDEGSTVQCNLLTLPEYTSFFLIKWLLSSLHFLGALFPVLLYGSSYVMSFFIISLPFYIYHRIRPNKNLPTEKEENDPSAQ